MPENASVCLTAICLHFQGIWCPFCDLRACRLWAYQTWMWYAYIHAGKIFTRVKMNKSKIKKDLNNKTRENNVVIHSYDPSTWETEAGLAVNLPWFPSSFSPSAPQLESSVQLFLTLLILWSLCWIKRRGARLPRSCRDWTSEVCGRPSSPESWLAFWLHCCGSSTTPSRSTSGSLALLHLRCQSLWRRSLG